MKRLSIAAFALLCLVTCPSLAQAAANASGLPVEIGGSASHGSHGSQKTGDAVISDDNAGDSGSSATIQAEAKSAVPATKPEASGESKAPPSLFDDPRQTTATAHMTARVLVPHALRSIDTFAIYPYPVKPPVIKGPAGKLPTEPEGIKHLLLATGYTSRSHPDKPYPTGGWRWQYATREAVRKSGMNVPHTLVGAYQWVSQMMPYVIRETTAWNDFEAQRYQRYQKTVAEFEKTRQEVEEDSVRQGLYPMPLRPKKGHASSTEATIPAGNWWLTCTRKGPGITYYWQVPFSAAPGEKINLTLTQPNALVITGGW